MPANDEPNNRKLDKELESISNSMQRLLHAGINLNAICILVANETNLGSRIVSKVLTELPALQKKFCTPENL
jgi:hypothetical protein